MHPTPFPVMAVSNVSWGYISSWEFWTGPMRGSKMLGLLVILLYFTAGLSDSTFKKETFVWFLSSVSDTVSHQSREWSHIHPDVILLVTSCMYVTKIVGYLVCVRWLCQALSTQNPSSLMVEAQSLKFTPSCGFYTCQSLLDSVAVFAKHC